MAQYLLNLALLVYVLGSNLGTRPVTRRRLLMPLVLVLVAGVVLLRSVPTLGNDLTLELVGVGAGVGLGVVGAVLVRVDATGGRLTATAGVPYAALWTVVIGGRVLFAYGADHWFPRAIAEFSMRHEITGADAWTSAFVLMALVMVLARVSVTASRVGLTRRRVTRAAVA